MKIQYQVLNGNQPKTIIKYKIKFNENQIKEVSDEIYAKLIKSPFFFSDFKEPKVRKKRGPNKKSNRSKSTPKT